MHTNANLQVDSIDDSRDFKAVQSALRFIQTFDQTAVDSIWRVVAAIIHLGNLEFNPINHNEESEVADKEALRATAELFDVDANALGAALCSRVVAARGDVVSKQHNVNDALFGRDALAKVLSSSCFAYLASIILPRCRRTFFCIPTVPVSPFHLLISFTLFYKEKCLVGFYVRGGYRCSSQNTLCV